MSYEFGQVVAEIFYEQSWLWDVVVEVFCELSWPWDVVVEVYCELSWLWDVVVEVFCELSWLQHPSLATRDLHKCCVHSLTTVCPYGFSHKSFRCGRYDVASISGAFPPLDF